MKKVLKIFLFLIIFSISCIVIYLIFASVAYGPSKELKRFMKEKKALINPSKCSPDNCEACTSDQCINFESCTLNGRRFSCGPSCDGSFRYCVKK